MITEQALLKVLPAQISAFENAMHDAKPIISRQPGFQSIRVLPAAEAEGQYLLLVEWETLSAHRDGFRRSEDYQHWKKLLHHFYDPLPSVSYFGESLFDD